MTRKRTVILFSIVLCITVILSACTIRKAENIKTAKTDNIEQENPSTTEREQEDSAANEGAAEGPGEEITAEGPVAELTEEPAKEPAGEPVKERTPADKENQKPSDPTGTVKQQSPVQQNTSQKNSKTVSTNTENKTASMESMRSRMLELVNSELDKGTQQGIQEQNTTNQPVQQQNPVQENTNPALAVQKPLSIEEMRKKMLELVNAERKKAGVKPLTLNSDLMKLAQLKAEDMVKNNYFDHNSPTYGLPNEMAEKLGYVATGILENICLSSSVESAHEALMNSPGHRANILRQGSAIIGIGIQKRSDGRYIFVQMFAEDIYNPDLLFERTIKNAIAKWCSQNSVPALKQVSKLNSLATEYFNALIEGKDVRAVNSSKYTTSLAGVVIHSFTPFSPGTDSLEKGIIKLLDSQKNALPSSYGFAICSKIVEKTETFTRYANYVIVVIEGQAVEEGQEIPFQFSFNF